MAACMLLSHIQNNNKSRQASNIPHCTAPWSNPIIATNAKVFAVIMKICNICIIFGRDDLWIFVFQSSLASQRQWKIALFVVVQSCTKTIYHKFLKITRTKFYLTLRKGLHKRKKTCFSHFLWTKQKHKYFPTWKLK